MNYTSAVTVEGAREALAEGVSSTLLTADWNAVGGLIEDVVV